MSPSVRPSVRRERDEMIRLVHCLTRGEGRETREGSASDSGRTRVMDEQSLSLVEVVAAAAAALP